MTEQCTILAVDDQPQNLRLLEAVLTPRGYKVVLADSGEAGLERLAEAGADLVLLDILMPGIDGYEVCRRIRSNPKTAYLPVVMLTASGDQEKIRAIEAGADDFVSKPLNHAELLARVASLIRVKRYQDTIERQAAELSAWNQELEKRVDDQLCELERVRRLRRFLSPQLTELVVDSGDESFLESHRREIVVVFCDLRGFTSFAESSEPEEVMAVLAEYHAELGELVFAYQGTLDRFTGDGLMAFFNDPIPCDDAPQRAVRMAIAMRDRVAQLEHSWRRRGHSLGFGMGVAQGFATLGRVGFEGRFDYTAIGSVINLSARLCAEAQAGQILITQRVASATEDDVETDAVGALSLRGFSRPIAVFDVTGLKSARVHT
jgi:adenylate cyclase